MFEREEKKVKSIELCVSAALKIEAFVDRQVFSLLSNEGRQIYRRKNWLPIGDLLPNVNLLAFRDFLFIGCRLNWNGGEHKA